MGNRMVPWRVVWEGWRVVSPTILGEALQVPASERLTVEI